MKIITRDFGETDIDENTIITMPEGIIGFEDSKRYTLLSPLGEDKFPMWLQSVDSPDPCFVVYDPMQIYPDYRFEISDEEQEQLRIDDHTPYRCLSVAIVPDDYRKTTINLRCPIVLNTKDNIAAQVILTEHYEFKCPVYAEEE
jgi:flagellar assembly factor FliW